MSTEKPIQDRRKAGPRRRAHDVVIYQDQDEWVVYDSIADKCFRFNDGTESENHTEAIKKFREIKAADPLAEEL